MKPPTSPLFLASSANDWEELGNGVRRKILGYDDHLMMTIVEFHEGSIGALHDHPHRQVSFIASGSFEVHLSHETQTLKTGDSFFVPPNMKHGVRALERGSIIDVFTPFREDFLR